MKPKYIKDAIRWSRPSAIIDGWWLRCSDMNYIEDGDFYVPAISPIRGIIKCHNVYPYEDWMEEYIGTSKNLLEDERFTGYEVKEE